jgi:hypothetical protein
VAASFPLSVVIVSGTPPVADTFMRPTGTFGTVGAKTIVSSGPQLTPRTSRASHSLSTLPPLTGILFMTVWLTKPTQFPSGEVAKIYSGQFFFL